MYIQNSEYVMQSYDQQQQQNISFSLNDHNNSTSQNGSEKQKNPEMTFSSFHFSPNNSRKGSKEFINTSSSINQQQQQLQMIQNNNSLVDQYVNNHNSEPQNQEKLYSQQNIDNQQQQQQDVSIDFFQQLQEEQQYVQNDQSFDFQLNSELMNLDENQIDFMQSITQSPFTQQSPVTEIYQKPEQKKIQKKTIKKKQPKQQKQQEKASQKKSSLKKATASYDKNICRYIVRQVVRSFSDYEYWGQVKQLCNINDDMYFEATQYYLNDIEKISGFKVLKEYLIVSEHDSEQVAEYKRIFLIFYKWFLKNRYSRYIQVGRMDNNKRKEYIDFKNKVMLKHADQIEKWNSNQTSLKQQQQLPSNN